MNAEYISVLESAARWLETAGKEIPQWPVVAGFDAFIDESIRIVAKRHAADTFTPMATISDFGQWAMSSAGRSGGREFIMRDCSAGGCSLNLADGLAVMGFQVDAFVGVGDPVYPVFQDFCERVRSVEALGMGPGRTIVLEFDDGKLLLGSFTELEKVTPEFLRERLLPGTYRSRCESAAAIVFTSWAVYPHMTACWKFLQKEVLCGLTHRPRLFFDLADPVSRTEEDILEMLGVLAGFESIGPVTLSVNGNEANQLARVLGIPGADETSARLETLAVALRERINITEMVIHLIKSATAATHVECASIAGAYCPKPVKSVGAGDRFNVGYLASILSGLPVAGRLAMGCASSGFFVRNARSGTGPEIARFLREWSQ